MEKRLTPEEIIVLIQKHSLVVRCLPDVVISNLTYIEGDENKKYVDANGKESSAKRSVVLEELDLEHFQRTAPPKWSTQTPEERYMEYRKRFPNGRKFLREERVVEKAGWWYVKEVKNTDSIVRFNRETDDFFAPTLEEAVRLYLNSFGEKLTSKSNV